MFTEKLNTLLKENKISRRKLCEDLHIGINQIKYWEKNNSIPNVKTLTAIAEYFQVPVSFLLDGSDKKEKPTEYDGLSEKQKVIMDFVMSVPDDKAEMILRVMKSILEADE